MCSDAQAWYPACRAAAMTGPQLRAPSGGYPHRSHGGLGLLARVDHRHDDALGPGIEHLADDARFVPRHPDDRGVARQLDRLDHADRREIVVRAVLVVDAHITDRHPGGRLGAGRARDRQPDAEGLLAVVPLLAQAHEVQSLTRTAEPRCSPAGRRAPRAHCRSSARTAGRRPATLADAMCGVTTTFSRSSRGWPAGSGSGSVTSRPGAGEVAAIDRVEQRVVIDEGSARTVDQVAPGTHRGECLGVHDPEGRGQCRGVERDDVALGEHGIEVDELDTGHRRLGECRVGGDHPHAEPERGAGHARRDAAAPDEAEGAPVELERQSDLLATEPLAGAGRCDGGGAWSPPSSARSCARRSTPPGRVGCCRP